MDENCFDEQDDHFILQLFWSIQLNLLFFGKDGVFALCENKTSWCLMSNSWDIFHNFVGLELDVGKVIFSGIELLKRTTCKVHIDFGVLLT